MKNRISDGLKIENLNNKKDNSSEYQIDLKK